MVAKVRSRLDSIAHTAECDWCGGILRETLQDLAEPPTAEELERLLSPEFPRLFHPDTGLAILKVWDRGSMVRQGFHPRTLRPGGTISGASMMMLTDFTMYVAVLGAVGWVPAVF